MAPKDRIPQRATGAMPASQKAYDAIVELILSGGLRPGERTSLSLLEGRLSIGRAPIKEAITRLQSEGVLSVASRSGTSVTAIDAGQTAQLFALRRVLEEFAAEEAVKAVTPLHIARLRALLKEMGLASDREGSRAVREAARFVRANVEFHRTLVSAAGNAFLDRLYAQLQLQVQIVTYLMHRGFDPKAADRRQREHEGILAALEARDGRLLKERLASHAKASEAAILKALSMGPA